MNIYQIHEKKLNLRSVTIKKNKFTTLDFEQTNHHNFTLYDNNHCVFVPTENIHESQSLICDLFSLPSYPRTYMYVCMYVRTLSCNA